MRSDTFSNRLKKAMDKMNMKQVDLVNKTKIDKTLINKYLQGVAEAKQDNLTTLAKALDTNEVWLMGYDVQESPYEKYDISKAGEQFVANNKLPTDKELMELMIKLDKDEDLKNIIYEITDLGKKELDRLSKLIDVIKDDDNKV